jgi:hypothetical protein
MATLVLHSNPTAQWHALVNEAQLAADCQLGRELESYLVFVLMRFVDRPDLAGRIFALDFLHGTLATGSNRQTRLRDVGDQCLLYSGLFPEQAEHRHVSVRYFVDLGRTAYHELATRIGHGNAELFAQLASGFITLMDVLLAMRALGGPAAALAPLAMLELGRNTGSRYASQLPHTRRKDGQSAQNRFVDSTNSSRIKPH